MTTEKKLNKEQVYDQQIDPLIDQIVEICKANGIAMVASFALPTEQAPYLRRTISGPDETGNAPADFVAFTDPKLAAEGVAEILNQVVGLTQAGNIGGQAH